MKKDNKHISSSISKDDFKDFLEGNMNEQQRELFFHEIEKDEFSNEAIKGFQNFYGSINEINDIDKNIKTKINKKYYASHLKLFSAVTIVTVIIIILISMYIINKTNIPKEISKINLNIVLADTRKLNVINREIDQASLLPASEQITSSKTKIEQKQVNIFEKDMPIEMIKKIRAISINNNFENENINLHFVEQFKYIPVEYMFGLKVVDYTKIYRTEINKEISDNGSLAPKFENRQNAIDTLLSEKDQATIPYVVFLKDAMGKFSSNNFKEALHDYIVILQHYPDDQNAHFYGGLCYYNIGLYENAITFFNKLLESNIATFTQETLWYKALSFNNNGNRKKAEILFNKIIEAKGFYSNRASEIMQENK